MDVVKRQNTNNRQILLNVGLTPKGGNYKRIDKLRFAQLDQWQSQEI
jgi:hypothetical protein